MIYGMTSHEPSGVTQGVIESNNIPKLQSCMVQILAVFLEMGLYGNQMLWYLFRKLHGMERWAVCNSRNLHRRS